MLGRKRRLAILAEGRFTSLDAKTAVGVLRYRAEEVVAVVDSSRDGSTAERCVGVGGAIPVVASLEAAAARGADSLLIGTAPQGGELPLAWRPWVGEALDRGWDVLSGLHAFLADDPELAGRARAAGARLVDVRRPPMERPIAARRAADVKAMVVLTVGTDCNVGKMTTALELRAGWARRGVRAAFVATGQTGILVADEGVAVDAVPADFVAGAVERRVVDAAQQAEVVLVEGQGALHHPAYSGVTLGLLHGACPRAMVLCHEAGRERVRRPGAPASAAEPEIPALSEVVRAYQAAAAWVRPAVVAGIALNTCKLSDQEARRAVGQAEEETGLPATDPIRHGPARLIEALETMRSVGGRHAPRG